MRRKQTPQIPEKPAVTAEMLAGTIAEAMSAKKGVDILILDMRRLPNRVAEFFVICGATSVTQAEALADHIEVFARAECGMKPVHVEGLQQRQWVLLDYFDVVAHIFTGPSRSFFRLEELWADAEVTRMEA
ncbi:MAG TPA: ribosome silencing factor [Bacteroidales bacterium]|nr:ribosome silencing factor [Bacteroidales bacterium]HRZ49553.1 ribosome silencing factor [Bacteroidales bacterium]